MGFAWNFRGYPPVKDENERQAEIAAEQARAMQGYRPAQVPVQAPVQYSVPYAADGYEAQYPAMLGGEGGRQRGAGDRNTMNLSNYGLGSTGTAVDDAALREEYARNDAEIKSIRAQLSAMDLEYRAGENRRMDELDMKLAANRAGIGDMGTAAMHQNRILTRKQIASDNSSDYNNMKDRDQDANEIDSLYIQRADAAPAQQVYIDRAIARKEAQFEKRWGEKYGGIMLPTGTLENGESPVTLTDYDQVLSDAKKEATDGYLTKSQIDSLRGKLERLPKSAERQQRLDALNKEVSLERHQADVKKNRQAEDTAIDEAMENYSGGWKLKTGDTATYTAKNGKPVTVSRVNGRLRFAIGKNYKEK